MLGVKSVKKMWRSFFDWLCVGFVLALWQKKPVVKAPVFRVFTLKASKRYGGAFSIGFVLALWQKSQWLTLFAEPVIFENVVKFQQNGYRGFFFTVKGNGFSFVTGEGNKIKLAYALKTCSGSQEEPKE
jgi:hypothetical protein